MKICSHEDGRANLLCSGRLGKPYLLMLPEIEVVNLKMAYLPLRSFRICVCNQKLVEELNQQRYHLEIYQINWLCFSVLENLHDKDVFADLPLCSFSDIQIVLCQLYHQILFYNICGNNNPFRWLADCGRENIFYVSNRGELQVLTVSRIDINSWACRLVSFNDSKRQVGDRIFAPFLPFISFGFLQ
jgi:hypothetical protein